MENGKLERNLIVQSEEWSLIMRIGTSSLEVALFPSSGSGSEPAVHRTVKLAPGQTSPLKSLEDAIYENPLLLCDFHDIHCIVDTPDFIILPPELEQNAGELFKMLKPEKEFFLTPCPLGADNATLIMGLPNEIEGFLKRTFYNVRLGHALAPLCRFFSGKSDSATMYIEFRPSAIDVVAFDNKKLLMANTFAGNDPMDNAYYIISAMRMLSEKKLLLKYHGESDSATETLSVLNRLDIQPSPISINSTRIGSDMPLDLIATALCE